MVTIFDDNVFKRQGGFSATPVLNDIAQFAAQRSARTKTPVSTRELQALAEGAIGGMAEKASIDSARMGQLALQNKELEQQQQQFDERVALQRADMRNQERQFESAQQAAFVSNITGALVVGGISLLGQNWSPTTTAAGNVIPASPIANNLRSLSSGVSSLASTAGSWLRRLFP